MNSKEDQTEQKMRGGYYTPDDLAYFLTSWVAKINPIRVLEPSCGDGVFFCQIGRLLETPEVVGFEVEKNEANKAILRAKECHIGHLNVRSEDFLGWASNAIALSEDRFDAVLGNPPFIRYQFLPSLFQERAERIFKMLGCKFTKHTNAWVPFILASFELLKAGGRLAMVVPSEIIHVLHAMSLRSYLAEHARRIVIIDPEDLWFDGTLQGAVLLLVEKKHYQDERAEGVGIFPVRGRDFLRSDPEEIFNAPSPINGESLVGKWTPALLRPAIRNLLNELRRNDSIHRFDDLAQVDVGIVTGANKFFLVNDETVSLHKLGKWSHPMFGRSEHCPGIVYDEAQHRLNSQKGLPTNFIWLKDRSIENDPSGIEYVRIGENAQLHKRYKCRIRSPWYSVPSVYSTEVGMLKRSHYSPRLIMNEFGAYTTDTAYRIRTKRVEAGRLVYCFINALTALSAELEGRHYGGGVLELVPSEIEQLLIPMPKNINIDIRGLDDRIRAQPMDVVLEQQTELVLGAIGLTQFEQNALLEAWNNLRKRRQRVATP